VQIGHDDQGRERVDAVRGDPDHGYTRGSLCPKVNRYERTVSPPGRVLTPLLRAGPKGSGQFTPTSWDDALSLIARRWHAIRAAHGGEAILPVSYAGTMGLVQRNALHPLFHKLGASLLDRAICTPAQEAGWAQVMGDTPGPDPDDVLAADLVVLWGTNALATNIHFLHRVKKARERGAHVVLIDTWRQPTADHVDATHLVRPGSDAALALGLLHVLHGEGLVDHAFLDAHVQGYDVLARDVLPAHTPADTAARTGLHEATVVALARAIGRAKVPFVRVGGGPFRTGRGAEALRAMLALVTATGAWARGGGLFASTGTADAFDASSLLRPDLMPTPRPRVINLNRLGHALTELGNDGDDGPPVHAIYVSHCNPAAVCPDQNAVLRGLARDDLFTVVHERFLTDTARYADVVLPAPTMLETSDLYRSYGQFFVQRTRPVIAPVGECRSNWDTIRALAAALGFHDDVFGKTADEHIDAVLDVPSPWRAHLSRGSVDRAALDRGEAVRLTPPRGAFLTPSGRIELSPAHLGPPRAQPTWADLDDAARFPLRLQPAPALYRLNSSFAERDDLNDRLGGPALLLHPDDAAARDVDDGALVVACNLLGETRARARLTTAVPRGVVVAEGVFTLAEAQGPTVNALLSQRLTDHGAGSTFSDNRVEVARAPEDR